MFDLVSVFDIIEKRERKGRLCGMTKSVISEEKQEYPDGVPEDVLEELADELAEEE
jgi:hypothetical protein